MGGVSTGLDALELVAAGASAVALGTVLFADPLAPGRIRDELEREASTRGFADPLEARGAAVVSLGKSLQMRENSTA
jgi:dihydroorotate dehydrogenase (NAD+) catalytic subunit